MSARRRGLWMLKGGRLKLEYGEGVFTLKRDAEYAAVWMDCGCCKWDRPYKVVKVKIVEVEI